MKADVLRADRVGKAQPTHETRSTTMTGDALTSDATMPPWGDLASMVVTGEHYAKAPIIEALVELRVAAEPAPELDLLLTVMEGVEGYGEPETLVTVQGEFQVIADAVQARATGGPVGHRWRSVDGLHAVTAQTGIFAFSRLAPYDRWETFIASVEGMWLRYKAVVEPHTLLGASVRFINRIDVPSDRPVEVKDYLRLSVDVPPSLPQAMLGMYMQVAVPLPQHDRATANIISTLITPPDGFHASLILDIDTHINRPLAIDENFHENVLGILATLRDAKNYVFESCITDATRGLIR